MNKKPLEVAALSGLLQLNDKVDATSLSGYDVQRKRKQLKNLFDHRKCDVKPTFLYQGLILTINQ